MIKFPIFDYSATLNQWAFIFFLILIISGQINRKCVKELSSGGKTFISFYLGLWCASLLFTIYENNTVKILVSFIMLPIDIFITSWIIKKFKLGV